VWVMTERGLGNPTAHGRTLSEATAALIMMLAPDVEEVDKQENRLAETNYSESSWAPPLKFTLVSASAIDLTTPVTSAVNLQTLDFSPLSEFLLGTGRQRSERGQGNRAKDAVCR
jgi:hypothetical protein